MSSSTSQQDNCQWLSVTEETLFLHDGLIRVTDLVALPRDVNNAEGENEVITFDVKSPTELSERLLSVCGTQNNAYSRLLEYRLNALRGFWAAKRQLGIDEQTERESDTRDEAISLLKKQGLLKEPEQASFSTRISILLTLPLLQSQSRIDPSLCGLSAGVLLNCLRDCAPLSLSKEPSDCLLGLETLLCNWLGEKSVTEPEVVVKDAKHREIAASALVALATARGHIKTYVHTIHLLQKLSDIKALPVADILVKLLDTEGGHGQPTSILGSKHVVCWGFEDMLVSRSEKPSTNGTADKDKEKEKETDVTQSVACDGTFLYTANSTREGLSKMGTGLRGSLRGYVYSRNPALVPGRVAFGDGALLYKTQVMDQEADAGNFCLLLDQYSLQPLKVIPPPEEYSSTTPKTTIAFCSDGTYFYWIWYHGNATDKNKGQNIYLETFKFDLDARMVIPQKSSMILQKKDDSGTRTLHDTLLSRLRPYRSGPSTATLVALTGGETTPANTKKEEATSSLGLPLKLLSKSPTYCDGSSVVILGQATSGGGNSARSLFGSGGGLSGLRSLATCLCYNVSDGQFNCKVELTDAPTCALARGVCVTSLGACFDAFNNMVWTCSNDWVDQYCNPGHLAPHHINARLTVPKDIDLDPPTDNLCPMPVVLRCLLHHVGSMCLHQINSDLLLSNCIIQPQPFDLAYLQRVCDILEKAVQDKDDAIIICSLIVLQLIFRVSIVKGGREREVKLIGKARSLVWKLLTSFRAKNHQSLVHIHNEACCIITSGLLVMYPKQRDRNDLLCELLTEDVINVGLCKLRDAILLDFAVRLQAQTVYDPQLKYLRLSEELVQYILKMSVKESCMLLLVAQKEEKEELDKHIATVPLASPCLQYLMALQSHLLREAVLHADPQEDSVDSVPQENLQELQMTVLGFASRVFSGACEVLETLLETCNGLISGNMDDLEYRLQALERITKATILGHLLPVLLTSLTHHNLRCLSLADSLMPQLVHLVVLTSQAALLMKSQVHAIHDDDLDLGADMDVKELIGESLKLQPVEDREEEGFLAGLKIPAPWASGKAVETIHPVRDNYKFKDTVHIPGARCLYLRFDTNCASQYDYDKLVVYAGPNANSKKIAEFGGNSFGFGSRSVLGSGWPKDLLKIDGDSVTFSFEMRSGREHNTPDKAMWGFLVTVRAQESAEEISSGLPFLADLALGLSVLSCTMLHLLYQGPDKTEDEGNCEHLLKSKLLQRCVWQSEIGSGGKVASPVAMPIHEDKELKIFASTPTMLQRIKLPTDVVQRLSDLSGRNVPQLRPSIRNIIQPAALEECIVSAILKHLSLMDTVHHSMMVKQETAASLLLRNVMEDVFRRIDALVRQLQSLADLEQRWQGEVEDHQLELLKEPPFFLDYHLQEFKVKELAQLCFLRDVKLDPDDKEDAVKALSARFDADVAAAAGGNAKGEESFKTTQLVAAILDKLSLLLHVTIAPVEGATGLPRSMSQIHEPPRHANIMVRSDTEIVKSSSFMRSLSAPADVLCSQDDSIIDIMRLQRRRQAQKKGPMSMLQHLAEEEGGRDRPPYLILLDQLFSFIGSDPEKVMSCDRFLDAAKIRQKRGQTRKRALVHMRELLTAASRVGGSTHLVAAVTSVLQHGPRVQELMCGGMVNQVREAFAETMTSVVQLAARYPVACCNSIGLLCIIPYTRAEEKCLVRSGLVHLLDKLCSLKSCRGENSESHSTKQKVSAMVWAGFQVLANRCVTWETEDGSHMDNLEHSGLACQVSTLLTNHLARATECSGNEAAGTEALQEVLGLLNNLSRSKMGKAILSQPGCVSKLLSLLLDQRPSPRLVLIILQLCRVALPLMSPVDCERVDFPAWCHNIYTSPSSSSVPISDPPARIVSLLLAKLGDYLTPGDLLTVSSRRPSMDSLSGQWSGMDRDKREDSDVQDGRMSVFVHRRDDQSSHEVIQPLLSSDSRPFRLVGLANMERVVRLDREMTKNGRAEITMEDAVSALRKAAKWAQMGLVVSTGPPVDATQTEITDKKKNTTEVICKDKNSELSRTDPVRPFMSGHVANVLAAEVIALLHGLMNAPETSTAQTWVEVVQRVLLNSLASLPLLLSSVESLGSPRCNSLQLISLAKQANATLCALGGFSETIKPGCQVKIIGDGVENSTGAVISVSEQNDVVTIQLDPNADDSPRFSDTMQAPMGRVRPVRNDSLVHHSAMTEAVVVAILAVLLPPDGSTSPLMQPLPVVGDGNSLSNQTCRVVSEIQMRACTVLASYLQEVDLAKEFIQHCGSTLDALKSLAKGCSTGDRFPVIHSHCEKLRMLYRDCAKPPPPPNKVNFKVNKEVTWDARRSFPPVRACLFSHGLTGITFLGDLSVGSGLPRGTWVYASQPIPSQAPSFYWELEICSYGDQQEESGAVVSFGFAPPAEKKDGSWTNPVGTCLYLNNGKAVHYNGASLLQWRSIRLDVTLNVGDVAGIGWERGGEEEAAKGQVYFTYKGRKLLGTIDDVSGNMYPVVHIQKKNTRIKANFGARPFAFAEGQHHRDAADACADMSREIRESFGHLPFHSGSDSDSDGSSPSLTGSVIEVKDAKPPPGPPCRTAAVPKSLKEYSFEESLHYKLLPSYDNFVTTGPDTISQQATQEDLSDDESVPDDQQSEDHHALLVKAWEQKVFPIIRRRFRNEAERKDGLEQIRGALQLGMTDIARQTVEFLYEENGGMPRDLVLPTIDDIREDLAKFTIERVRKGTMVSIRSSPAGATVLPKFAVRGMLRTFGLLGTVLDVDTKEELVQVETYLRTEGVLVRFWYPIEVLERPPQGLRKSTITGGQTLDTSNVFIHRELLQNEARLSRMYCRTALLQLIDHCNSPAMDVQPCSSSLGAGMAASTALLQELDIENIQLLSNQLLAPPHTHGTILTTSASVGMSPRHCMAPSSCSLTDVVYNNGEKLKRELAVAIARAANQGEDYLLELTNQICLCLQTAPEMFPYEEFPVTEVKVTTDVHFPGAACLVVSCKADPKAAKKETSPYKSPWARVFSYTGQRVKKSGQFVKVEVVSYPRDITTTSNTNDQYSPVIIPCDRIHLRLGVSPTPGVTLTIHALPSQFLLATAYTETLVMEKNGCGINSCLSSRPEDRKRVQKTDYNTEPSSMPSMWNLDNIVITPPVFQYMIKILMAFMCRTSVPALIKEYMFQLLAQTLRMHHHCCEGVQSGKPSLSAHLNPTQGFISQLQNELRQLYDEETKGWTSLTTPSGAGIGLGVTDSGRFSSYFHSLMDLELAIAEVTTPATRSGLSAFTGASSSTSSPPSASKKKKLKSKKERTGATPKRSVSVSPRVSGSDSSASASASNSSTSVKSAPADISTEATKLPLPTTTQSVKAEDMLWFRRAVTVSQIVRTLAFHEAQGDGVMMDAISDAAESLNAPTAHSRLLVITCIPTHLDQDVVKKAIRKVTNANGGLSRDDIFLPIEVINQTLAESIKNLPDKTSVQSEAKATQNVNLSTSVETQATKTADSSTQTMALEDVGRLIKKQLKGYAVINLKSKVKVETVRKALYKSPVLVEGLSMDGDELIVPEDMLSMSLVSQMLVADQPANAALEHFFSHKVLIEGKATEITDGATLALTEIFHSCFISDQQQTPTECRQESGYICFNKDQILQNLPENLLCTFFNNVRPPKKSCSEQVTQVLRQYGLARTPDKEISGTDKGKSKGVRKLSKSSKEKLVLGVTEKTIPKEKKSKGKELAEKPSKDVQAADSSAKSVKREEERLLTLDGFLQFVMDLAKQDIRSIWRALLNCGFDLLMDRCACIDVPQAQQMARQWTLDLDGALVTYINEFCSRLAISTSRIHPHEIYITESELSNEKYACLQGIPVESIRLRFAFLQSLNNSLETFFLPLVDLRPWSTFSLCTAAALSHTRSLIFCDSKVNFMNRILNATMKRKADQAAPEITFDPLESINGEKKDAMSSITCQALRQLANVPSSKMCVNLASGGNPMYSFNVRHTGEEVQGTSGSFRHFLWQVASELQGSSLNMFTASTNNEGGKGKHLLKAGPMTYTEEKLLLFLGQLLGITIRGDIPIGLDIQTTFWKNLVGVSLDPTTDLQESDGMTYSYIKKLEMAETEAELQALCADVFPRFVYTSLSGDEVELIPFGSHIPICWENRHQYVSEIRALRMRELSSVERVSAVMAGLASIVPIQVLALMSPMDMELRTCGLPHVDLDFLKNHTRYHVGLTETHPHVEHFWTALEAFSQQDLCRFIKFACNQDRIPQTCPCMDGGPDTAHVPPYPMKIAPPDGTGSPDGRHIRVETCMFMISLPQYSTQEIMTQRLLYAIHCREDPLSG